MTNCKVFKNKKRQRQKIEAKKTAFTQNVRHARAYGWNVQDNQTINPCLIRWARRAQFVCHSQCWFGAAAASSPPRLSTYLKIFNFAVVSAVQHIIAAASVLLFSTELNFLFSFVLLLLPSRTLLPISTANVVTVEQNAAPITAITVSLDDLDLPILALAIHKFAKRTW